MLSTTHFQGSSSSRANSSYISGNVGFLPKIWNFPVASLVCWILASRLSVMIATAKLNFSDSCVSTSFSVCSSLCSYISLTRYRDWWMMSKHMQCMWLKQWWGTPFCTGMHYSEGNCCVVNAPHCKVLGSTPLDIVTACGSSPTLWLKTSTCNLHMGRKPNLKNWLL